jgi:hypothetical protein
MNKKFVGTTVPIADADVMLALYKAHDYFLIAQERRVFRDITRVETF